MFASPGLASTRGRALAWNLGLAYVRWRTDVEASVPEHCASCARHGKKD